MFTVQDFQQKAALVIGTKTIQSYQDFLICGLLCSNEFKKRNFNIGLDSLFAICSRNTRLSSTGIENSPHLLFLKAFKNYFLNDNKIFAKQILDKPEVLSHEPCMILKNIIENGLTKLTEITFTDKEIFFRLVLNYIVHKDNYLVTGVFNQHTSQIKEIFSESLFINLGTHCLEKYKADDSYFFGVMAQFSTQFYEQFISLVSDHVGETTLKKLASYYTQKLLVCGNINTKQRILEKMNLTDFYKDIHVLANESFILEKLVIPKDQFKDDIRGLNISSDGFPYLTDVTDIDFETPISSPQIDAYIDHNKKRLAYANLAEILLAKIEKKQDIETDISSLLEKKDFFQLLMRNSKTTHFYELGLKLLKSIIDFYYSDTVYEFIEDLERKSFLVNNEQAKIHFSIMERWVCQIDMSPQEKLQVGCKAIAHGLWAYCLYMKENTSLQELNDIIRLFTQIVSSLIDQPFSEEPLNILQKTLLEKMPTFPDDLFHAIDSIGKKINLSIETDNDNFRNLPFSELLYAKLKKNHPLDIFERLLTDEHSRTDEKRIVALENEVAALRKELNELKTFINENLDNKRKRSSESSEKNLFQINKIKPPTIQPKEMEKDNINDSTLANRFF